MCFSMSAISVSCCRHVIIRADSLSDVCTSCLSLFGITGSVRYFWPAEGCWVLSDIRSRHLEPRETCLKLSDLQIVIQSV